MSIFADWPHNWFGLWKTSEADLFQLPLLADVIDVTWQPADLADIIGYLQSCPVSLACGMLPMKCPLCGELLTEPGTQRSDGQWVWPSSLAHDVGEHHVRLPDRMVERIRGFAYKPPALRPQGGAPPAGVRQT